jgi:hypothetical protein
LHKFLVTNAAQRNITRQGTNFMAPHWCIIDSGRFNTIGTTHGSRGCSGRRYSNTGSSANSQGSGANYPAAASSSSFLFFNRTDFYLGSAELKRCAWFNI